MRLIIVNSDTMFLERVYHRHHKQELEDGGNQ